jgi:hypothetical protein
MVGDGPGADKGDVRDGRVRGEVAGDVGPADDGLDDVGRVTAGFERAGCDGGEVRGGPGGGFGALDYDGVAGEDGRDDGADEVVELDVFRVYASVKLDEAYRVTTDRVS